MDQTPIPHLYHFRVAICNACRQDPASTGGGNRRLIPGVQATGMSRGLKPPPQVPSYRTFWQPSAPLGPLETRDLFYVQWR